jgi:hypothetical protein
MPSQSAAVCFVKEKDTENITITPVLFLFYVIHTLSIQKQKLRIIRFLCLKQVFCDCNRGVCPVKEIHRKTEINIGEC